MEIHHRERATGADGRQEAGGSAGSAVELRRVSKRFGRVRAIDALSLQVPLGSIFGLVGPNGAGKTTLLRLLVGLLRPDEGTVLVLGAPPRTALRHVGAMIDRPAFYPHLSGRDNLRVIARAGGVPGREIEARCSQVLELTGLASAGDRRVSGYSTGMKQRLGVAAALLASPRLVLLDEPTSGLDPQGIVDLRALIRQLAGEDVTIILSSHLLGEVERICSAIALIDRGQLRWSGPMSALLDQSELRVRLENDSALTRAELVLSNLSLRVRRDPAMPDALLLSSVPPGLNITAALASNGLYPTELTAIKPTLEESFLKLLAEVQAPSPEPGESGR